SAHQAQSQCSRLEQTRADPAAFAILERRSNLQSEFHETNQSEDPEHHEAPEHLQASTPHDESYVACWSVHPDADQPAPEEACHPPSTSQPPLHSRSACKSKLRPRCRSIAPQHRTFLQAYRVLSPTCILSPHDTQRPFRPSPSPTELHQPSCTHRSSSPQPRCDSDHAQRDPAHRRCPKSDGTSC